MPRTTLNKRQIDALRLAEAGAGLELLRGTAGCWTPVHLSMTDALRRFGPAWYVKTATVRALERRGLLARSPDRVLARYVTRDGREALARAFGTPRAEETRP